MEKRNWFWGLVFLLAAICLIAVKTSAFATLGAFTIITTALLVIILVLCTVDRMFFGSFVSLVFLYEIYRTPLNWPNIGVWYLLLVALLASIGVSILFPKWRKHNNNGSRNFKHGDTVVLSKDEEGEFEDVSGNVISARVQFGSSSKYIHSQNLEKVHLYTSFGSMQVYFDQAQLSPRGAEVIVDCSFGSIELFIPRHWRVINDVHASLGAVEMDNAPPTGSDAPVITLRGSVSLGAVEIKYV